MLVESLMERGQRGPMEDYYSKLNFGAENKPKTK